MKKITLQIFLFFCFLSQNAKGAIRDYYSNPSTRIDDVQHSGQQVMKFGFYNDDAKTPMIKQPVNLTGTYFHAASVLYNDEAVFFTSNFEANIKGKSTKIDPKIITRGKVNRSINGVYEGTLWPQTINKENQNKVMYYVQYITGKDAGNIYRIHSRASGGESAPHFTKSMLYPIPKTTKIFAFGRDLDSKNPNRLYDYYVYIYDMKYKNKMNHKKFETKIKVTMKESDHREKASMFVLTSNSLNSLGKSQKGRVAAELDFVKNGRHYYATGYIDIDLKKKSAQFVNIVDPFSIDTRKKTYGEKLRKKKRGAKKSFAGAHNFNHYLSSPTDKSEAFFVDENFNNSTLKSKAVLLNRVPTVPNLLPVETLKGNILYHEASSEKLTHPFWSDDGTEILAYRVENAPGRPLGVVSIDYFGNHTDLLGSTVTKGCDGLHVHGNTVKDLITIDCYVANANRSLINWHIYIYDRKLNKIFLTRKFDTGPVVRQYFPAKKKGDDLLRHPFHPHPSFSHSGEYLTYNYVTEIPGTDNRGFAVAFTKTETNPDDSVLLMYLPAMFGALP